MVWGLNGPIMQHVAHRLNVAKWEAEKREKREKRPRKTHHLKKKWMDCGAKSGSSRGG